MARPRSPLTCQMLRAHKGNHCDSERAWRTYMKESTVSCNNVQGSRGTARKPFAQGAAAWSRQGVGWYGESRSFPTEAGLAGC